jgi:hypothetical protein
MNVHTLPGRTGADHPLVKLSRNRGPQLIGHRRDGRPIYLLGGGAGNPMLENLVAERDQCLSRVDGVTQAALESGRDLSDQDEEVINRAKERVAKLDQQIELLSFDRSMSERTADALRANNVNPPGIPQVQYRSAGAALWDLLHQDQREARERLTREMHRAAQHMGADAANTVATAGGLGALVVRPIVGPVIDPVPGGRPFLTLLGVQQLDSPLGFSRPRIADPNGDQAPDTQGAGTANAGKEKAELVSRAFDIKLEPVDTETIGEYLNVSQKLLSLPIGALNIILGRFAKRRARKTERYALAAVRESTSAVDLAADAAAGAIYDAIWDGAERVYAKTGELPEWMAVGPTAWSRLGRLRDLAERPLFPTLTAGASVNSMGRLDATTFQSTGPAGLPMAVTYGITDGAIIMGNSASLEVYEYPYPMLEAVEPAVLGRQIAVASELGTYRPATDGLAGDTPTGNGAVVIAPAAP